MAPSQIWVSQGEAAIWQSFRAVRFNKKKTKKHVSVWANNNNDRPAFKLEDLWRRGSRNNPVAWEGLKPESDRKI